jgi:hypothetical protein
VPRSLRARLAERDNEDDYHGGNDAAGEEEDRAPGLPAP